MDSYSLTRNFWNWAFDNPEIISPNHAAIYMFSIEHCNRLGWKKKFGLPSQMVMDAIGIKKHSTYIRYFNDLVEFGFFELVQKSKNQYSSNIISLIVALPKKGEALDKAILKHGAKQTNTHGQSMGQSKRSINKQLNQEQLNQEQLNNNTINFKKLLDFINLKTGRDFKIINNSIKNKYKARIKDGYKNKDIEAAIINATKDEYHKSTNYKYLTPEFFSRNTTLDKWGNTAKPQTKKPYRNI